jgi:hypothetical protein
VLRTDLLGKEVGKDVERGIADGLPELLLALSGDVEAVLVLALLVHRRVALEEEGIRGRVGQIRAVRCDR